MKIDYTNLSFTQLIDKIETNRFFDLPRMVREAFRRLLSRVEAVKEQLDSKLDKDTTAGVERVYTINPDGSQATKPMSEFKDVLEFANLASFPAPGETGKIYLALDTNKTYRWSGSAYVQIGGGAWGDITGTLSDQTDLQSALDSKLDKVSTAGVERAYIINADGSQATKPTSELGGTVTLPQVKGFAVDFTNANNIGSAAEMPNIALASGTADYTKNTISTFEIGHTGIVALRSSANINSGFSFFKGGVINNGDKHINFTQFKIISNTNTKGYIGFHKTTATTEPVRACFLEVVNGTAVFKTKGTSLTTASSSFSLSENVWYNMLIEFKSTTEVYFKIKTDAGVLVSEFTSTTNLPQFNISEFSNAITFFSTVATTARDLIWLDYVEFRNERPNYLKSF